jgi:hypothetical protein
VLDLAVDSAGGTEFRGPGQDAVHETVNVDSDDLYPVFVSAVAANYDRGFAGMPTLTDLVEALRPIEESYAGPTGGASASTFTVLE